MNLSRFLKAAPLGLSVACVLGFVLLNGLGLWQLSRLDWKQTLIRDLAQTQGQPPVPAQDALSLPKPDWRAVILPNCTPDPTRVLRMHSSAEGQPGFRVLMVCPVGDTHLLVDLGFMAQDLKLDVGHSLPKSFTPIGRLRPFEKVGMVTPPNDITGNDWYWRSPDEMGKALGTPVRSDYFVVLDLKASAIAIDGLQQGQLTAPLPNRHLEYALTWFALAWTLLIIYVAYVVKAAKAQP